MAVAQSSLILAEIMGRDEKMDTAEYDAFIKEHISHQPMAFGMGYWFEPYYTNKMIKFYGPYFYKNDAGKVIKTMKYNTESYDYFTQKWYTQGLASDGDYLFSKLYHDTILDTVFMTASSQIIKQNKPVGLVTVDITLREFKAYLDDIKIGQNGKAFIVSDGGYILGNKDMFDKESDLDNELSLNNERIVKVDTPGCSNGPRYISVWSPIGMTDLKVVLCFPKSELMSSIYDRIQDSVFSFVTAMILFILVLNIVLKQMVEKPLLNILNSNASPEQDNSAGKKINQLQKQPTFDNMIELINRLFHERNTSIAELNETNDKLVVKNDEIKSLYQQTSAMNDVLHELLDELRAGYIVTVRSLSNAIEAKDRYTKGHCEWVTRYALETAKRFNVSNEDLTSLEYASLLHDIGKIGMPNSILCKPDRLTDEEYEIVKQHPSIGYNILKDIEFLGKSTPLVRHHHERIDGKGYPDGLTGNELDLLTKILAVADAFDAMVSSRPYRKRPLAPEQALSILKKNVGTQFDGKVVGIFSAVIRETFMGRVCVMHEDHEDQFIPCLEAKIG